MPPVSLQGPFNSITVDLAPTGTADVGAAVLSSVAPIETGVFQAFAEIAAQAVMVAQAVAVSAVASSADISATASVSGAAARIATASASISAGASVDAVQASAQRAERSASIAASAAVSGVGEDAGSAAEPRSAEITATATVSGEAVAVDARSASIATSAAVSGVSEAATVEARSTDVAASAAVSGAAVTVATASASIAAVAAVSGVGEDAAAGGDFVQDRAGDNILTRAGETISLRSSATIESASASITASATVSGVGEDAAAGGFTPADLFAAGEQGVWYDPSDLTTMWTDTAGTTQAGVGDAVARIDDKSGNGNHATQATAADRPILRQDGAGKYYLEFDGSGDFLSVPSPGLGITDVTTSIAYRHNLNAINRGIVVFAPASGNDFQSTSGFALTTTRGFEAICGRFRHDVGASEMAPLDVYTHKKTEFESELRSGGVLRSTDGLSGSMSPTHDGDFFIGVRYENGLKNYAQADFFGIVARSAQTDTQEITDLETYLADKAGITL